MPLYEFFCAHCRKKSEELCGGTVKSISCPSCGRDAGKVFSTFSTAGGSSGGGTASSSCGG